MRSRGRDLPRLVAVTNRHQCAAQGRTVVETVSRAVEGGLRAVVLRDKDLPAERRAEVATELRSVLSDVGGSLLIASDPSLAVDARADGIHLAADDPSMPGGSLLVGRSTHTSAELAAAAADGVDYVSLSPIFETRSKPGYGPPIGLSNLAEATMAVDAPAVFALGGIDADNARSVISAGAHGAFVMGAIMASNDPAAAAASLLESLS